MAGELDEVLGLVMGESERRALYDRIAENVRAKPGPVAKLTRSDWAGACVSFCLVFLASLPAAAPFLVMDDAWLALRVSNALLLALLFYTGYKWSQYTMEKGWLVGVCFLLGGVVLVAVAIALGG